MDDGTNGDPTPPDHHEIGWPRAIATGLAILVVGLVVTVWGSDQIMKQVSGMSRDTLSLIDAAFFVVAVCVIAWVLRRLQGRGLI